MSVDALLFFFFNEKKYFLAFLNLGGGGGGQPILNFCGSSCTRDAFLCVYYWSSVDASMFGPQILNSFF